MKNKYLLKAVLFAFGLSLCRLYALEDVSLELENTSVDSIVEAFNAFEETGKLSDDEEKTEYKYTREKIYPEPRRPKKPDEDKIREVEAKNEKNAGNSYIEQCRDTFKYGLETEIQELIDELTKNEDLRMVDYIYDLFLETKSPSIRQKILSYFTKLKDPCLADYAVEIINDPYDEKRDVVSDCFKYVSEAGITDAVPGLVDLVDKEEDEYFDGALSALGELGGVEEARFIAQYLDRSDLSVSQRQALMRVLGRIKAVETYEKLAEIAQDEDENSYVRMYAAEAIGAMEKSEAEEILVKLFEESDPNFRVYVIKGISHFTDEASDKVITQGLRDSQWKVRQEAVNAVKERKMTDCVPYLIYRCKDKSEEKVIKDKCYDVIAFLNTQEGNEYLISVLDDKKIADGTKATVAACLLKYDNSGTEKIIELARECLKSDIRKSLRYALGKEFAKYGRPSYESICSEYLASEDVSTQGTGLDIWAKGRYKALESTVMNIAQDALDEERAVQETKTYQFGKKKKNANASKAKRILEQAGIKVEKITSSNVDAVTSPAPNSASSSNEK